MTEKEFWKKVQRGLGSIIDGCGGRLDRVENGVCDGMPDVSATAGGVDVWIELKYCSGWPSRANTRVMGDRGLRPEQINWHLRHQRAGGRSFVLVGIGKEMFLAQGQFCKEMNSWVSADWLKDGRQVDGWDDLYRKLFTKYL